SVHVPHQELRRDAGDGGAGWRAVQAGRGSRGGGRGGAGCNDQDEQQGQRDSCGACRGDGLDHGGLPHQNSTALTSNRPPVRVSWTVAPSLLVSRPAAVTVTRV